MQTDSKNPSQKSGRLVGVTGGAGMVGAQLIREAVSNGDQVLTIIRANSKMSGRQRFLDAMRRLNVSRAELNTLSESVTTLEGNIESDRLGLSEVSYQACQGRLKAIYHTAGNVDFQLKKDAALFERTNVHGAAMALKWARDSGCPFYHVSTAYAGVAGKDFATESLNTPGSGRNFYEESKIAAERLIVNKSELFGIPYAIFRPSILMGESGSGAALHFRNMYQFMKALQAIGGRKRRLSWLTKNNAVRLFLNPSATLNIVPMDVMARTLYAITTQPSDINGKIFHLTNPTPPTMKELGEIFSQLFSMEVNPMERRQLESLRKTLTREETALDQILEPYHEYLESEPRFDLTNTEEFCPGYISHFPEVKGQYFDQIIQFANDVSWGKRFSNNTEPRTEIKAPAPTPDSASVNTNLSDDDQLQYTHEYFQDFLTDKIGAPLIANLVTLSSSFIIRVREEPFHDWSVKIEKGSLVAVRKVSRVSAAELKNYHCIYTTDLKTFEKITQGRLSPSQAFFDRLIDIRGNFEEGLRVASALMEFFQTYPFTPDTKNKTPINPIALVESVF